MEADADVVIVGGGLLGLSTAYALAGRRDVLVLERDTVGHARGGSHGPSRIFRLGYQDPAYVRMAQRARERWRALEERVGVQLLRPTPQLTFGPGADAVHDALAACGAPVERLRAAEVAERYPVFAGHGDAVVELGSAVIAADRVLEELAAACQAEIREGIRVHSVGPNHVDTDEGTIAARAVVVCAGPWSRTLVPTLATTTTLEHVVYLDVGESLPIFIDFRAPATYGLPTPGTSLYKIGIHGGGSAIDPEAPFVPNAEARAQLESVAAHWLPNAQISEIDVCPYDNTADERFVLDRIDGVIVGAGTSGHAFKFGPLLGDQLAELVCES